MLKKYIQILFRKKQKKRPSINTKKNYSFLDIEDGKFFKKRRKNPFKKLRNKISPEQKRKGKIILGFTFVIGLIA